MEDQLIDSLKEWFEKEWLFERHLTSEFMKDKEAFVRGCEYFDQHQYAFKGELLVQLRKESGLAEVARGNQDLEKYAIHCYRQVEKVFSEFIYVNPGRKKLGEYFLNEQDMIQNPSVIQGLNPSIVPMLYHKKEDGSLNDKCLILKLNYILKEGNYLYQAPDSYSSNPNVKSINTTHWNLSHRDHESIFKATLWFDTFGKGWSNPANSVHNKPNFEALGHMYFFRNIGSHLNSDYRPFKMPIINDPFKIKRIKGFYDNPMDVMNIELENPGFYQRYVDMILFLYSEYLRNDRF
jgi:hypothetical protein